ncbi:MAG: glutathione S-transferase [Rhodospirillaceae bacterium]|nr:glutathione S-transferase [Rhodospirillaceae bacterium]OUU16395.1 MAG: glutathione S-transferase [Candidatus Endolissoclinum sp. TMED37]|tara:strand:+ start:828 stop:1496 length:669 start_codon:yes stop_codon:yes gene_type:complete
MPSLLHLPLDPFSRKIRIVLGEKKITASLAVEPIWERRHEFLSINPAGTVPVFIEDDGTTISTSQAIAEYLEETSKEPALIFGTALQRAEIRRLCNWFDVKFNTEVTEYLLGEKIMKRFLGLGEPSSETIRAGYANIDTHLGYIEYLAEQRAWLAGENFSLADITAASHISCIDYLGDIAWEDYQQAKQWYARIKSRPSFRPLLQDLIPGTQPPAHYKNLDF